MKPWVLLVVVAAVPANAQRSFFTLPSSNGHSVVVGDASKAAVVHFRERLPATEEPVIDAQGADVFAGNQPQIIKSRNLLFDAYFGLRSGGTQRWLTSVPVDASGYDAPGSGMASWSQKVSGLELTTWVFAPRGLPHAAFVMALRVRNATGATIDNVSAFSLLNVHLGFGRPGPAGVVGTNGETVVTTPEKDIEERGFAGVVLARPVGFAQAALAWNGGSASGDNGFQLVQAGGTTDFPSRDTGNLGVANDWASGFQFSVGTMAGGEERWLAVVVASKGDPFAAAEVKGWLDGYAGGKTAQQLVEDERAQWAAFQQRVRVPAGASASEAQVARQSAAMLAMAQVREREAYLREWLTQDGEVRRTRFPAADGGSAALPTTVRHQGQGAVLACLPPGEWTYAWTRDGAYAAAALSALGLDAEASDALRFVLSAQAGRFAQWNELKPYAMPPYLPSLTRYTGFGVEETDFNGSGPNLEFDGFGLVLWALRDHEKRSGDLTLTDSDFETIATRIADPLVALVDPATHLLRKDSSIWETHWNGRERSWAFTNITAVRGLCDAAAMAERRGEAERASRWRTAALSLRAAIAERLTDGTGALASNAEELASGEGYLDAAVLEAFALGLFRPDGRIARATFAALDAKLKVTAGPGWARNDDRADHAGKTDLSPWGSEYDSAEWVFTDLRGAMGLRAFDAMRADALVGWTTQRSQLNAGVIPETYDEVTGAWKFNAPMIGFGAGAYVLALAQRGEGAVSPACGAFFDESAADAGASGGGAGGGSGGGGRGGGAGGSAGGGSGGGTPGKASGCGCATDLQLWPGLGVLLWWTRRGGKRRGERTDR
ncbi:MAG: glycosyl hydrolase [Myxococcaceae bacterium]|nr:glycosyl hydrolase [Myxococcaceae bacterium]